MSDPLPEMIPVSPLGGRTVQSQTHGPVSLTDVTNLALASLAARRGQETPCKANLADLLGLHAPEVEQFVMQGSEISAFWMGPDQWMISAPHDTHENLAAQLKAKFDGSASITEQNDAWAIFDLVGDGAPVMELLCPIDMRTLAVGRARRTTIDHLGCFVIRVEDDRLRILGPRSSAGSLHHALLTAMRSAH